MNSIKKSKLFLFLTIVFLSIACITPVSAKNTLNIGGGTNITIKNNQVVLDSKFKSQDDAFKHVVNKYKNMITFFSALSAITMVGVFIYNFTRLGISSCNPQERQKVLVGLLISGIGAALLGSVSLFFGLFYSAFQ